MSTPEELAMLERLGALTKAVQGLDERAADLNRRDEELTSYGHRNRTMIVGLVVTVLMDVALSVFAIHLYQQVNAVALQAKAAAQQAANARGSAVNICEAGNVARAQNKQLWDYLLGIPPATNPTAAEMQERARFQALVVKTFAQRDCSKL